jgi:murein DD-endopeptidase MepM/ murein hydrolase activator NlpD
MRRILAGFIGLAATLAPAAARGDGSPFAYDPPGTLVAGSGKGRPDDHVYAPQILYPIESGPAYANSQVWGHGGASGPSGTGECDAANFRYPWHDNFCETRDWSMPLCPSGSGHQGQDTRAVDCKKDVHTTVAVVDGTITSIGSYSVYLTADDGQRFDYLHMSTLVVKEGERVKRGQPIGKVSNHYGTSTTTVHLHFNVFENVAGVGAVYVPPYSSLVLAYQDLMGIAPADADAAAPSTTPPDEGAPPAASSPPAAPEGSGGSGGCALAPRRAASLATVLAFAAALLARIARRRR